MQGASEPDPRLASVRLGLAAGRRALYDARQRAVEFGHTSHTAHPDAWRAGRMVSETRFRSQKASETTIVIL